MEMNIFISLALVTFSSVLGTVFGVIPHDFNRVKIIETQDELDNLINTKNVAVVYYYKKELGRIRFFFKEFDKSAELLTVYGVVAGIVDCTGDKVTIGQCKTENVEQSIYTYRESEELLVLDLETMFDVNSIMSNVLQLVLLHEVPIIQNKEDLHDIIHRNKGKQDIIFSYQKAIGTYEHRIFMEVAFAYQDKYAFAVTTEREAVEDFSESGHVTATSMAAIWMLHCKDLEMKAQECIDVKYKGKMDLPSLAKFLRSMSLPKFVNIKYTQEIHETPYQKENMDVVFFIMDPNTEEEVMDAVDKYVYNLHGVVGVGLIDIHSMYINKEMFAHVSLPGLGVKYADKEDIVFMNEGWSQETVDRFLNENVLKHQQEEANRPETEQIKMEKEMAERAKYNLPTVEEVETEDDQVAGSVFKLRDKAMELDHVLTLKDVTFNATIKNSSLLMVLYYVKFDAASMAFLRAYGQAAELLYTQSLKSGNNFTYPLAKVNCYDWTDVCGKVDIREYPTVHIYRYGKFLQEYKALLDTQAVVSTITLLQAQSPVKLTTNEEVGDFLVGKNPKNISSYTDVSVLGVFDSSHKRELSAFRKVVKDYRTTMIFGVTDSVTAKTASPLIMIARHTDPYQKDALLMDNFDYENIKYFIEENRLPVLPELTPVSFPDLFEKEKALVILFVDESVSSDLKEMLAAISISGRYRQYMPCWMDINADYAVGKQILAEYTNSTSVPAISLVNNRKGNVYNFPGKEFTENRVVQWLDEIVINPFEPSMTLSDREWKPAGRSYDFLAMMDYEAEHGHSPELADNEYDGDAEEMSEDKSIEEMEARSELLGLDKSRFYHSHKVLDEKAHSEHIRDEL